MRAAYVAPKNVVSEVHSMKRQKRDLTERAFQHGYQAGLGGRRRDLCPHTQGQTREQWIAGWREGRSDLWDGYGVVPGIQKMALR